MTSTNTLSNSWSFRFRIGELLPVAVGKEAEICTRKLLTDREYDCQALRRDLLRQYKLEGRVTDVLATAKEFGTSNHAYTCFINNNIGLCLNQLARYAESEPTHRLAIRLIKQQGEKMALWISDRSFASGKVGR